MNSNESANTTFAARRVASFAVAFRAISATAFQRMDFLPQLSHFRLQVADEFQELFEVRRLWAVAVAASRTTAVDIAANRSAGTIGPVVPLDFPPPIAVVPPFAFARPVSVRPLPFAGGIALAANLASADFTLNDLPFATHVAFAAFGSFAADGVAARVIAAFPAFPSPPAFAFLLLALFAFTLSGLARLIAFAFATLFHFAVPVSIVGDGGVHEERVTGPPGRGDQQHYGNAHRQKADGPAVAKSFQERHVRVSHRFGQKEL